MNEQVKYLTRQTPGVVVHKNENYGDYYRYSKNGDNGAEAWKLDVGAECNRLNELADNLEANRIGFHVRMQATQNQYADTLRSIAQRVAAFKELEVEL